MCDMTFIPLLCTSILQYFRLREDLGVGKPISSTPATTDPEFDGGAPATAPAALAVVTGANGTHQMGRGGQSEAEAESRLSMVRVPPPEGFLLSRRKGRRVASASSKLTSSAEDRIAAFFPDIVGPVLHGHGHGAPPHVADFPVFDAIPPTAFSCAPHPPGFFADQEAGCQVRNNKRLSHGNEH